MKKIVFSRAFLFSLLITVMFAAVIYRFYDLQVINGGQYQTEFEQQITREREFPGSRGTIYDRNGVVLAYNELSYNITITDQNTYNNQAERNTVLNQIIDQTAQIVTDYGDSVLIDLPIRYSEQSGYEFTSEGTQRLRFLADLYGHAKIEDLSYNQRLGYDESTASAEQVLEYLSSASRYNISIDYNPMQILQIASVRYAMDEHSYRRYIPVILARDVAEVTMTSVLESKEQLPGIEIAESTQRRYSDSTYFAHILGYTGAISAEEREQYQQQGISYSINGTIGKAGIEQALEAELKGQPGHETFTVDYLGRITESLTSSTAAAGNDIYLTIDSQLQKTVYDLLEQKLAGILLSNYSDDEDAPDLTISTSDIITALIENRIIKMDQMEFGADGSVQHRLYQLLMATLTELELEYDSLFTTPYQALRPAQQIAADFIAGMLTAEVTVNPPDLEQWQQHQISLDEYIRLGINNNWISGEIDTERYSTIEEELIAIKSNISERLWQAPVFHQELFLHLIAQGEITNEQICLVLIEQETVGDAQSDYPALANGTLSAYSFLQAKIQNLEITPAQLALDPSTGSSVVVDPNTGEILASVTYPGYDNNRLANTVDGEYYQQLLDDKSLPLYNNATQQRTAPGSTFKLVTVAAGLASGTITEDTLIEDRGVFEEITPSPRCWIYPIGGSTHGAITVTEAIRHSCNYFFYQLGYQFSDENGVYTPQKGVSLLQEYSQMFGFDENSGIELSESAPQIADEFPVTAAIGQSNHNYTTTQLARYSAVLANQGNLYDLTFIKEIRNPSKNTITVNEPVLKRSLDGIDSSVWNVISNGMGQMAESNARLGQLPIKVAGKTGTAQQNRTRPNHALFIGYAPYDQPQIAVATRIAYGYSSANAVEVTSDIFQYYFGIEPAETLVTGQASRSGNSGNIVVD